MDKLTQRINTLAEERGLNKNLGELGLIKEIPNSFNITTPRQFYQMFYSLNKKSSEEEAKKNLSEAMKIPYKEFSNILNKIVEMAGKEFIELYEKLPKKEHSTGLNPDK